MIVFDLKCAKDHVFEAWFPDSAAFDEQAAGRKIVCPACGSRRIAKAPMAPRLARGRDEGSATAKPADRRKAVMAEQSKVLAEMRRQIEANCDYVGPAFAEEARKIHYGEVEKRNIYGEATSDEAAKLKDEGVDFHSVPWPREDA